MNTDWRGLYNAPLWLVGDYLTVLAGETLAANPKGKQTVSDALAGYEMETVTEVIEYQNGETQ